MSGRLVAAIDDDALVGREAVHLDEQLVQRLLALFVAERVAAAAAADGVELVDEDDAGRMTPRILEQPADARAPTPAYISTKSDPLAKRNGTFASPAIDRASSVLPVPGGPTSSTPFGMRPPIGGEPLRLAQEIDDLLHFLLGFVRRRRRRRT